MQRGELCGSSLLFCRLPAAAAQRLAGFGASKLAVFKFELPIHEYVLHAFGKLIWLRVSCAIANGGGIEDCYVSKIAGLQQAAIAEALALRRQGRNFANCLLERNEIQIPNVVAEEARHA